VGHGHALVFACLSKDPSAGHQELQRSGRDLRGGGELGRDVDGLRG
jgi:hypothetical protein